MNLYRQLTDILNREKRAIAQITGDLGGGSWTAQTQSGSRLILHGQAATGQRVFYDVSTNRILERAPEVELLELGV